VVAWAIEIMHTIEPSDLFEWVLARRLLIAYKSRLRAVVETMPSWVSEEILSDSEHIGDQRAVLRMSDN